MKQVQRADVTASGITDLPAALSGYSEEVKTWKVHMERVEAEKDLPDPKEPEWVDFGGDTEAYKTALDAFNEEKAARHSPYPAPILPPLVASLLEEDGSISTYEVMEPVVIAAPEPTAEEVFQSKRQGLFNKVQEAQAAAEVKLVPLGKRRLIQLRSDAIAREDMKRNQALNEEKADLIKMAVPLQAQITELAESTTVADITTRNKAQAQLSVLQEKIKTLNDTIGNLESYHKTQRPAEDQKFLDDKIATQEQLDKVDLWGAQVSSDIEDLTPETIDGFTLPPLTV